MLDLVTGFFKGIGGGSVAGGALDIGTIAALAWILRSQHKNGAGANDQSEDNQRTNQTVIIARGEVTDLTKSVLKKGGCGDGRKN